MTCMNEVHDWYEFVDVQMSKINAIVLSFFHITMHSPFGFLHCSDEKIAGCVHWFLTFALQQIHIQSLTSKSLFVVSLFSRVPLQQLFSTFRSQSTLVIWYKFSQNQQQVKCQCQIICTKFESQLSNYSQLMLCRYSFSICIQFDICLAKRRSVVKNIYKFLNIVDKMWYSLQYIERL